MTTTLELTSIEIFHITALQNLRIGELTERIDHWFEDSKTEDWKKERANHQALRKKLLTADAKTFAKPVASEKLH